MGQVSELNTSLVGVFHGFRYIEVISFHSIIDVSLAFSFDNTPEKFPTEKETWDILILVVCTFGCPVNCTFESANPTLLKKLFMWFQ